ncbi:MAG: hypothetical protein AAF593_01210 [Planctomycetota bacterium]
MINYDSDEAATLKQIGCWVSRDGSVWSDTRPDAEHMARYCGCTHRKCQGCDAVVPKQKLYCDDCLAKRDRDRWEALPCVEWDGQAPLCTFDSGHYFFHEDELCSYLDGLDDPGEAMLVACRPDYGPVIDSRIFEDHLPEDDDFSVPPMVQQAMTDLNKLIRGNGPYCWWADDVRVDISVFIATVQAQRSVT